MFYIHSAVKMQKCGQVKLLKKKIATITASRSVTGIFCGAFMAINIETFALAFAALYEEHDDQKPNFVRLICGFRTAQFNRILRASEKWSGQRILETLVCLFIEIHSVRQDIRAINVVGTDSRPFRYRSTAGAISQPIEKKHDTKRANTAL